MSTKIVGALRAAVEIVFGIDGCTERRHFKTFNEDTSCVINPSLLVPGVLCQPNVIPPSNTWRHYFILKVSFDCTSGLLNCTYLESNIKLIYKSYLIH